MNVEEVKIVKNVVKKQPLSKKMIAIFIAVLLLCAIGLLIYINSTIKIPEKLEIVEKNGQVYLYSSYENNPKGYVFKFKDGIDIIEIHSNTPKLSLSQMQENNIKLGKEYSVSVAVEGEISGNEKVFSKEVSWIAKKFLDAPKISNNGSVISIDEVANADYYNVYFADQVVQCVSNTFDLSDFIGGDINVFVTACSNDEKFIDSIISNVLQGIEVDFNYHQIINAQFVDESKTLKINSVENHEKIFVSFNAAEDGYLLNQISSTKVNNGFEIIFDLSLIYNNEANIYIIPFIKNEHYFYNFQKFRLTI